MSTSVITPPAQSLEAAFSAVSGANIAQEDLLKIAIIGEPGVGKSWLMATAPAPILVFDFDGRAASLAGKPGLLIKSKPSMVEVEQQLSIAKARKAQKLPNPATYAFDSVTYMQRAMEEEIFRQAPDLSRIIKVGPSLGMKLRKGWDTINGIQRYMEYLIAEFSTLGNIIFVFHEKAEKDQAKSAPDKPAYTGDITIDPQYLANTLSLLDERYRIKQNFQGKYEVQCRYTGAQDKFNAITTMLLDPIEPPDIMGMIEKHKKLRAAQQPVGGK